MIHKDLDEAGVRALAGALARGLPPPPLCIHLAGDLGAGKTTFVRALLRALGHDGPVKSPTYGLLESYRIDAHRILHCDLYRLEDPEELEFLGLRDQLGDHVLLIEWPARGGSDTPPADLVLDLQPGAEPTRRTLRAVARSPRGELLLNLLKSNT